MRVTPTNEGISLQQPNARPFSLTRLASAIRARLTGPAVRCGGAAAVFSPGLVLAGPLGEQVVAGDAQVARPDPHTTEITQGSSRAILEWQSFSIAGNEYVQFKQPGSAAVALNRVVGENPSSILGRLDANGRVFLVNPRGVYFGPGAQVDVGGLVASVQDIADQDFLAGRYVFARSGESAGGTVMNEGVIRAADGGYVVLSGDRVANDGVIQARLGTVVLASGRSTTLTTDAGGGLVDFAVDEATLSAAAGVSNAGEIVADGGTVLLSAKLAGDLAATAVNNRGLVQAGSVVEQDGRVFLRGAGGDVVNEGTVDVSGDGDAAGGRVLVKSDQDVELRAGSTIDASGGGTGDGGVVRVIADGNLNFQTDARVAASAGDAASPEPQAEAGFIELSGHEDFTIAGEIALDGPGGTILIDPATVTINNNPAGSPTSGGIVSRGFIETQLQAGNNVYLVAQNLITAGTGSSGGPTFTINGAGAGAALNLLIGSSPSGTGTGSMAFGDLGSYGVCAFSGVCGSGSSYFSNLATGGAINLSTVTIMLDGGLNVTALDGTVNLGNINANGVTVNAGTTGSITVNNINGGASANLIGNVIAVNAAVMAGHVDITLNGTNPSIIGGLLESIPPATPAAVDFNVFGANASINVNTNTPNIDIGVNVSGGGSVASLFINNNNGAAFASEIATFTGGGYGDVTVLFNGNGSVFTPAGFTANNLTLESLNGTLTFNNDVVVNQFTILFGLNVDVSGANLDTGALEIAASNGITSNVATNLILGPFAFSGAGDSSLTSEVAAAGISGNFIAPNAIFKANTINLQGLDLSGVGPDVYLLFDPAQLTLGPVATAPAQNILVQILGATPSTLIGVESSSATGTSCGGTSCGANFFADTLFDSFPNNGNVTFGVGGFGQTGNIFIGQNGIVNLGSQNLVVVTGGSIDNPANITTSGIVSSVGTVVTTPVSGGGGAIVSEELEEVFVTPVPTEFEEEQDEEEDENLVLEDEEGGDGGLLGFEEQSLTCS